MCKLLRFSESLGKSNEKKWSHIWKLLFFLRIVFFHLFIPSKRLFAPISKSQMFKRFRFSESLAKSDRKSFSQIWKLLLINGRKITRQRFLYFLDEFCLTSRIFWYQCYFPHWSRDALSPVCEIFFFCHQFWFSLIQTAQKRNKYCLQYT